MAVRLHDKAVHSAGQPAAIAADDLLEKMEARLRSRSHPEQHTLGGSLWVDRDSHTGSACAPVAYRRDGKVLDAGEALGEALLLG